MKKRTGVDIGKISYSGKLKQLSLKEFTKYWDSGKNEAKTGLKADKAAERFGIKKVTK